MRSETNPQTSGRGLSTLHCLPTTRAGSIGRDGRSAGKPEGWPSERGEGINATAEADACLNFPECRVSGNFFWRFGNVRLISEAAFSDPNF